MVLWEIKNLENLDILRPPKQCSCNRTSLFNLSGLLSHIKENILSLSSCDILGLDKIKIHLFFFTYFSVWFNHICPQTNSFIYIELRFSFIAWWNIRSSSQFNMIFLFLGISILFLDIRFSDFIPPPLFHGEV